MVTDDAQVLHLDPGYPGLRVPGAGGQAAEHPGGQPQLRGHVTAARVPGDDAPGAALPSLGARGVTRLPGLAHTTCKGNRVIYVNWRYVNFGQFDY